MKKETNLFRIDEAYFNWKILNFEFFKNFDSPHTRKCYERDIQAFFLFLYQNKVEIKKPNDIQRAFIVAYKSSLLEIDQAPKTICRKLSCISSYFDFLMEKGLMDFNPCQGVRRPSQIVKNETNDLSDEAVTRLFEVLFTVENESIRLHRAIIFLLFSTGIRKSELINLKVKDYFQLGDLHWVIKIRAKGGKYLTKVVHPSAKEILDDYINHTFNGDLLTKGDEFLFRPTKNPSQPQLLNKSLNPKTIDYIVKKYCKMAGIFDRISPHSARATYIGSALEAGVELWRVSQDVGHESIRTTESYNKRRTKLENSPVHSLGFFSGLKKSA